ncbi:nuclear distribution protein nudE like 1 [Diaporthe helianthi]|uniref:Nuclear distribution protein nudE like 1 n=1 Tax=Diaporthe helianthi TaxID=158607 RepID=A0A2P5I4N9_DIAHE|nr:nuclear distribution protein nudE like 1 [Diaporthe helianthi]
MLASEPPSSPPCGDAGPEASLAWYKSQYEQLENELADFRVSSEELEKELEKELEAAEKRENALKNKAEGLVFEVDEWKRKYKESKTEANAAQNALEKEITTLRDTNRTMQHKLRDIEVANDDFERQARITDSSLEDMESKYNAAIERQVMMEEEIKIGEQEREQLRIEAQRLREELSDLKIEAEILQDKLRKQGGQRHLPTISTDLSIPESPMFDTSTMSGASSPLVSTPPGSVTSSKTPVHEPPSPPMSDASAPIPNSKPKASSAKPTVPAPAKPKRSRLPSTGSSNTPRPRVSSTASRSSASQHSTAGASQRPTPALRRTTKPIPPKAPTQNRLPPSTSLTHIRTLTAQMQRLEARVQNARSKLPAPAVTPPRTSPRSVASNSNITIRSRKRGVSSVSSTATSTTLEDATPTGNGFSRSTNGGRHPPRLSISGVSRLSFGPLPNRGPLDSGSELSRPSSRASTSSYARPVSRADGRNDSMIAPPRPGSRAGGARTPLGRPISRTSFGSSFHGHSVSSLSLSTAEEVEPEERTYRTPSRRGTYSRLEGGGGIPTPSGLPMPTSRRQSLASVQAEPVRRPSIGPSLIKKTSTQFLATRPLGDLGETF